MAIYRGNGGAGDATNDITINQITELSSEAQISADAAASSATSASSSASAATTSATNAANSATSAGTSATNAASSASSASTSASNASTSETNAAASETAAAASEAAAALSETAAAVSETNAASSASSASTSASTATTQATSAATSATNAATSASAASTSETNAATSETNAATSETNAASSATSASSDAATATTKASEASTSASNAATSETNAAASESAAATSATNASTSETNAAASETAAASSASAAATSETNAATSASGAATSASNAATSASNAATSETNAATSETNAAASATAAAASATDAAASASAFLASEAYTITSTDTTNWDTAYGWGDHASAGYVVSTGDTMTGDLSFGDNDKAIFGAGSDLEIYHNGSHSYVHDKGTGNLILRGTNMQLRGNTTNELFMNCVENGRIDLYYNNAVKLATTNTGVNVTGTVTATDNVGIGASTVDSALHIEVPNPLVTLEDSTNGLKATVNGENGNLVLSADTAAASGSASYVSFEVDATEAMRINSSGVLLIGTTSSSIGGTAYTGCAITKGTQLIGLNKTNAGSATMISFNSSGTQVGSIVSTASATNYNTSSDYRLKEDVQPMEQSIERVKQLNPVNFAWRLDGSRVDGFLAHEAAEVIPEAVSGTKDAVQLWEEGDELPEGVVVGDNKLDDDGNTIPDYQGIDQAKLVPLLTSALQEAIGRIETLEAEVTALKG